MRTRAGCKRHRLSANLFRVTTRRGASASKVPALRNILAMEAGEGFPDRAVKGGLDKFLATLRREADADPALTPLTERGLLSVAYAELDAAQRELWAREVQRFIAPPSSAPAPTPPSSGRDSRLRGNDGEGRGQGGEAASGAGRPPGGSGRDSRLRGNDGQGDDGRRGQMTARREPAPLRPRPARPAPVVDSAEEGVWEIC